jgi:hypothetical protein
MSRSDESRNSQLREPAARFLPRQGSIRRLVRVFGNLCAWQIIRAHVSRGCAAVRPAGARYRLLRSAGRLLPREGRVLQRAETVLCAFGRRPVRVSGSSCARSDDLCACPGTCARGRRLVGVFQRAVRASGHLCAHPGDCATILRVCAGVQAICARVRRLVRPSGDSVRLADDLCAWQITCASGRRLVRNFGTEVVRDPENTI